MGKCIFSQEVIEKILSFADGETLLTCKKVSLMFADAVEYLEAKENIWEKCCRREIELDANTINIISKRYPHLECINHPKNWARIYKSWSFLKNLTDGQKLLLSKKLISPNKCSKVCDILTHGDLTLILVHYEQNFSYYYRILTLNVDNVLVDKSAKFQAGNLYITPIENSEEVRSDAILLYCESCKLMAIPVSTNDVNLSGKYPNLRMRLDTLKAEHSSGDVYYFNEPSGIFSKGDCFHVSGKYSPKKKVNFMNVTRYHHIIEICCEDVTKAFETDIILNAKATCVKYYGPLLLLGTETGMMYCYLCKDKDDIMALNLNNHLWYADVSDDAILAIDVAELEDHFSVVCCTKKTVHRLLLDRKA